VDRKNLAINNSRQTHIIKQLTAIPPHICTSKLSHALIIEPIDLRDLPNLMVSSDQGNPVGIANFEGEKEKKGLDTVESTIDKVAHEEVVGGGTVAAYSE
jgi:hypothetical protein